MAKPTKYTPKKKTPAPEIEHDGAPDPEPEPDDDGNEGVVENGREEREEPRPLYTVPLLYNDKLARPVDADDVRSVKIFRISNDDGGEKRSKIWTLTEPAKIRTVTWDDVEKIYGGGDFEAVGYGSQNYGNNGVVARIYYSIEGPPKVSFGQQLAGGAWQPGMPFYESPNGVVAATGVAPEQQSVVLVIQQMLLVLQRTNKEHEDRLANIALEALKSVQARSDMPSEMMKLVAAIVGGNQAAAAALSTEVKKLSEEHAKLRVENVKLEANQGIGKAFMGAVAEALPAGIELAKQVVTAATQAQPGQATVQQIHPGQQPPAQVPPGAPPDAQLPGAMPAPAP